MKFVIIHIKFPIDVAIIQKNYIKLVAILNITSNHFNVKIVILLFFLIIEISRDEK